MADGTVIVPQVNEAADPPLIPDPAVFHLSPHGLQMLVDEAVRAGLSAGDRRFALPAPAVPTVVFRLGVDRVEEPTSAKHYTTIVPGLLDPASDAVVPVEEVATREHLRAFFAMATNLPAHLQPDDIQPGTLPPSVLGGQQYQWVIQAADDSTLPDDAGPPRTASWASILPFNLASHGDPYVLPGSRCSVFGPLNLFPGGPETLQELRGASQHTRWEYEGFRFVLYLRPLLPGDNACRQMQEIECLPSVAAVSRQPGENLHYSTQAGDPVMLIDGLQLTAPDSRWHPRFVLYGDGKVMQPELVPAISVGPELLPWRYTQLSSAGVMAIVEQAARHGLIGLDQVWDDMADQPFGVDSMTRLMFQVDGRATSIVLSDRECALTMTDAELNLRAAVAEFTFDVWIATQSFNLAPEWFPADAVVEWDAPDIIDRLEVIVWPSVSPDAVPPLVWPLDPPLDQAGVPWRDIGTRCLVVEGDDLTAVRRVIGGAAGNVLWQSGVGFFPLDVRQLLPHEVGCHQEAE